MKKVIFAGCIALVFSLFSLTIFAAQSSELGDEFHASISNVSAESDPDYMRFDAKSVTEMSENEAQAAGVPSGYQGVVYSVERTESNGVGVMVDFREARMPVEVISTISFRVYVGDDGIASDSYPEVRIFKPYSGANWLLRHDVSNQTDQWVDITVPMSSDELKYISKDGFLEKFNLCVRSNATGDYPFYIDSITCGFKTDDGVAPVINYDGDEIIQINQGSTIVLGDAYDAFEKRNIPLYFKWKDGVEVDEKGIPTQLGTYEAKICATDFYGNTSEKSVKVVVVGVDNIAPEIQIDTDKIYATVGTIPFISPDVTDNISVASVTTKWSEGALDNRGRLVKGTHTVTITAYDYSDNKAEKIITVCVDDEEKSADTIIDEQAMLETMVVPTGEFSTSADVKGYTLRLKVKNYEKEGRLDFDDCSFGEQASINVNGMKSTNARIASAPEKGWVEIYFEDYKDVDVPIGTVILIEKGGFGAFENQYQLTQGFAVTRTADGWVFADYLDITDYKTNATYPKQTGKIFAGWYSDSTFTTPLGEDVKAGMAYAKFVDANVMTVKAQITAETTVQTKKTDIRFVSTVNDLNYREVGFVFDIEGRGEQTKSTTTVYKKLYVLDGERADSVLPSEFSVDSSYFYAFTYYNVPNANFETVFDVMPYWITLDGTTVYGDSVQKTIEEGAVKGLVGVEIGREDGEKW